MQAGHKFIYIRLHMPVITMQSSPKSLQIDAHYGVSRDCNLTIAHFPIDMFILICP